MTTRKIRNTVPEIKGSQFQIRRIQERAFFGLKPVWRGQTKVMVSDPSLGGGLRTVVDVVQNYLKSDHMDPELLLDYSQQMDKGVVYKRLGFLMERLAPNEETLINECLNNISKGNSKLDTKLPPDNLITRWRLWVPKNWKEA